MRIKINFTVNNKLPINNQHIMNSYIHKCLGINNKYHDTKNDYCISSICGGKLNITTKELSFDKNAYITVSSINNDFISDLLMGIMINSEVIPGMNFLNAEPINEIFISGWNHFATLSPFIIKEYIDTHKYKFITLDDDNFKDKVKNHLINKLSKINDTLDLSGFDINITKNDKHKVKKILVKNVINKANQCQISIKCSKNIAELIYNIGIGQSTGSGFGTIYKTENHIKYR